MKKTFFTLTLIAFCAWSAVAQSISGGIKIGANFANMKYSGGGISASADGRTSLHAGGYLNIGITDQFGIQPELLYSSQGAKSDETVSKSNYLTIPVMLRYIR